MKRNKRIQGSHDSKKENQQSEPIHMGEEDAADNDALITQLRAGFDQMDLIIQHPEPPALHELELLVTDRQKKLRKRAGLEWALFLVLALVIIGGNLFLATSSILVFAAIQGVLFIGAIAFVLRFIQRSRKKVKSGHA